jgi:hypothetical protein
MKLCFYYGLVYLIHCFYCATSIRIHTYILLNIYLSNINMQSGLVVIGPHSVCWNWVAEL